MLNKDELLSQKTEEIVNQLQMWSEENDILEGGEQLVFTLYIKTAPKVVREIRADFMDLKPSEFFTESRLKAFGGQSHNAVRICNCLRQAGLKTLKDVCGKSENELLRIKDFSRISLQFVIKVLAAEGVTLRDPDE
jgi:DNA-directed RNA polymerase alpha subunit